MRINEDFLDNIDAEDVKVKADEPAYEQGHPDNATMYRLQVYFNLASNYPKYIDENVAFWSKVFRALTLQQLFPSEIEDVIMEIEWSNDPYGVSTESTIIGSGKADNIIPLLRKMRSRDDLTACSLYLTFWSTGCSDLDVLKYKIRWRRIFKILNSSEEAPINSGIYLNIQDEYGREYELKFNEMRNNPGKRAEFLDNMYKIIQDYEEP